MRETRPGARFLGVCRVRMGASVEVQSLSRAARPGE